MPRICHWCLFPLLPPHQSSWKNRKPAAKPQSERERVSVFLEDDSWSFSQAHARVRPASTPSFYVGLDPWAKRRHTRVHFHSTLTDLLSRPSGMSLCAYACTPDTRVRATRDKYEQKYESALSVCFLFLFFSPSLSLCSSSRRFSPRKG